MWLLLLWLHLARELLVRVRVCVDLALCSACDVCGIWCGGRGGRSWRGGRLAGGGGGYWYIVEYVHVLFCFKHRPAPLSIRPKASGPRRRRVSRGRPQVTCTPSKLQW